MPIANVLLKVAHADPNLTGPMNRTPLLLAAMNGYEGMVKLLLTSANILPDVLDNDGCSAMHWAARNGHPRVVELLLNFPGTKCPDQKDGEGRTPLAWAATSGHTTIVCTLLESRKVHGDPLDNNYWTPLSLAASAGHTSVVEVLLNAPGQRLDSSVYTGVAMRDLLLLSDNGKISTMLEDYFGLKAQKPP
jgi:ankyrin repeat protein